MKKNGFSLAECVVSIGITLIICTILVTTTLVSVSNTNKTNANKIGINEIENVVKIVKDTNLEKLGNYNSQDLEKNLFDYYGLVFHLSEENIQKVEIVSLNFNNNGKLDNKGKIKVEFSFFKNKNVFFSISSKIMYNSKILYQKDLIFEKFISSWSE